ncbi:MAG TPA: GNAT family N-acetyltransferase [Actinomycetota bacterium]|nr:GNAT family N-acetyltransferase [Actinomycetota bacterium]
MAIEVRPVREGEHEETGRVTALAYREFVRPGDHDWEEYLQHIADVEGRARSTEVLVAVQDGDILGSATVELDGRIDDDDPPLHPEEAHIRMLGVHPDARGRGIARSLIDACLQVAREAGRTYVTLHTTQRMKAAQAMYDALGFERLEDRVFPDGFVLLTYRRSIPPA